MSKKHIIKLTCKEATLLSSKKEDGQLSFPLRLRLLLHILICPPCRQFIAQSKLIINGIRKYRNSIANNPAHILSSEKKQVIQDKIDELI